MVAVEQKPEVGVGNHVLVHREWFLGYPTIVTLSQPVHDLSTTQRYLGKVDDTETISWIETLYG